jgi:antitoxin component YwqK of YwqJK toxin-antitoxin module
MFLTLKVVKKNILIPRITLLQLVIITGLFFVEVNHAKAQQDGRYTAKYADSTVKERGTYLSSEKHGSWYYYHPNGTIERKERWSKGILRWQIFYNERGRVIKTIDRNGVVKTRSGCGC